MLRCVFSSLDNNINKVVFVNSNQKITPKSGSPFRYVQYNNTFSIKYCNIKVVVTSRSVLLHNSSGCDWINSLRGDGDERPLATTQHCCKVNLLRGSRAYSCMGKVSKGSKRGEEWCSFARCLYDTSVRAYIDTYCEHTLHTVRTTERRQVCIDSEKSLANVHRNAYRQYTCTRT